MCRFRQLHPYLKHDITASATSISAAGLLLACFLSRLDEQLSETSSRWNRFTRPKYAAQLGNLIGQTIRHGLVHAEVSRSWLIARGAHVVPLNRRCNYRFATRFAYHTNRG